jgi:hypothetical protein
MRISYHFVLGGKAIVLARVTQTKLYPPTEWLCISHERLLYSVTTPLRPPAGSRRSDLRYVFNDVISDVSYAGVCDAWPAEAGELDKHIAAVATKARLNFAK